MGVLVSIGLGLGSIAGVITLHLLADEIGERVPSVARRLIRRAASRLPKQQRVNYEEEWLAHLNECSGMAAKLLHAIGCVICAGNLKRFFERLPVTIVIDREPICLDLSTGIFVMWSAAKIMMDNPPFSKDELDQQNTLDALRRALELDQQNTLVDTLRRAVDRAESSHLDPHKLKLNCDRLYMLAAVMKTARRNSREFQPIIVLKCSCRRAPS